MSILISEIDDYVYPRFINWIQVTKDIAEHGLTYNGISQCMGVGYSTLQRWRTGSEPCHSSGSALLLIHAKYCGGELTKQRVAEADI